MKQLTTVALTVVTVLMISIFIFGCEGNDDDKDGEHDAKISSMSTAIGNLTGVSHIDPNGCTDGKAWTAEVEAKDAVLASAAGVNPVVEAADAIDYVAGFCS